jgi:hypothetical protein
LPRKPTNRDGTREVLMRTITYASPFKEGLRRGLRQILAFSIICVVVLYFVLRHYNSGSVWYTSADALFNSLIAGFIAGPIVWVIYRVARFTFGRSQL